VIRDKHNKSAEPLLFNPHWMETTVFTDLKKAEVHSVLADALDNEFSSKGMDAFVV
jgi:hypothetical protein